MATIKAALAFGGSKGDGSTYIVTWTPVTEADTCAPVSLPEYTDRSIHVSGTFGGATVTLVGSNNGGTTFVGLRDPSSTLISITADTIKAVLENCDQIKPSISGGTAQSLTISMLFRLANPLRQ